MLLHISKVKTTGKANRKFNLRGEVMVRLRGTGLQQQPENLPLRHRKGAPVMQRGFLSIERQRKQGPQSPCAFHSISNQLRLVALATLVRGRDIHILAILRHGTAR